MVVDPAGGLPPVPLPAAQVGIAVAVMNINSHAEPIKVLNMHRIPFWLAAPRSDSGESGRQRAVVLYVQVRPPPNAMFYPAVSHYSGPRAGEKRAHSER